MTLTDLYDLIKQRKSDLKPLESFLSKMVDIQNDDAIESVLEILEESDISPQKKYIIMKKIISETDYFNYNIDLFLNKMAKINFDPDGYSKILLLKIKQLGDSFDFKAKQIVDALKAKGNFKGRKELIQQILKNPHLSEYFASMFRELI